jgi:hypothetical protein
MFAHSEYERKPRFYMLQNKILWDVTSTTP